MAEQGSSQESKSLAALQDQVRALEQSEARFRALFEQSADGIFLHDLKGRLIDVNRQAADILGRPRDDLRNMPIARLCTVESRAQIDGHLEEVLRDGNATFDLHLVRGDGTLFVAEVHTALVELGDRLLVQGTLRDISLRRHLEEMHQIRSQLVIDLSQRSWPDEAAECMLEAMFRFEGFDCGALYLFEQEGGALSIVGHRALEPAFVERVRRYEPGDPRIDLVLSGQAVFVRTVDLEGGMAEDVAMAGLRSLSVVPIHFGQRILGCLNMGSRTLEVIPAHERRFVEEMAGTQLGSLIAERMAREEQRQSEERLRLLAEVTSDLTYEYDLASESVNWFGSLDAVLGYPAGTIPRTIEGFVDLLHPEDRVRLADSVWDQRERNAPYLLNYRVRRADGSWAWWEDRGVPVLDAAGQPMRLIGACKDVTERRYMEEALRQAEKMQAVGQLAGGVAHDFNNQLSGILGYTELMRDTVAADPVAEGYLEKILLGIKRAADLTGQLLAFSRKGKFLATEVDLHQVVGEVEALLKRSIDKRIVIEKRLEAALALTLGDPSQIQNAILNLALNARDAMPDGGTLRMTTRTVTLDQAACAASSFELTPGEYVELTVRDTGQGMDDETRRHIFEPFFTTKPPGKGTGMGLAAVYGTLRNHKAAIEVESAPGQGASFAVFFPALTERSAEPKEVPVIQAEGDVSAHILLVDDEDLVRGTTQAILERLGCRVTACAGGTEAIDALRADPDSFDLVILDLIMPGLSGRDTFRTLRELRPDLKVIVSSGYSLDDEAQDLLDAGAFRFLQKPFRLQHLADVIRDSMATMG